MCFQIIDVYSKKKKLYVDIILMSFQTYLPMDHAQKSYFE